MVKYMMKKNTYFGQDIASVHQLDTVDTAKRLQLSVWEGLILLVWYFIQDISTHMK